VTAIAIVAAVAYIAGRAHARVIADHRQAVREINLYGLRRWRR
jgi:hypothetical protein